MHWKRKVHLRYEDLVSESKCYWEERSQRRYSGLVLLPKLTLRGHYLQRLTSAGDSMPLEEVYVRTLEEQKRSCLGSPQGRMLGM